MQTRWSRVLRGLGAGTAATLVAAASHSVAGGRTPSLVAVTLALFFAVFVSIAVGGRGISLVRLAASVVVSQLAFHLVFSTVGGAGDVASSGHHGHIAVSGVHKVGGVQEVGHASRSIRVAHGVAALATLVAVRFCERAIHTLREAGRILVAALLTPPAIPFPPFNRAPQPAVEPSALPRLVRRSRDAVGTRGPPVALCGW